MILSSTPRKVPLVVGVAFAGSKTNHGGGGHEQAQARL